MGRTAVRPCIIFIGEGIHGCIYGNRYETGA